MRLNAFVADSIDVQSTYSTDQLAHGFLRLLDEYNRRVDLAELDKSLMIEIPANLQRLRPAVPEPNLSDPIPVIVYTDGRRIKTLTIAYKCIEFDSWLTLLPLRRS